MGGTKKKSLASMEKSQDSQDSGDEQGPASKGKKSKEQKSSPQQKKQLPFLPPKLGDAELLKSLTPLKAITIYGASRALGVNASVAAGVIRDLEGKSLLKKEGGFSGHSVWAVANKA
jgi:small subunit ribosomal protein S25e